MTTIIVPLDGSSASERAIGVSQTVARRLWADLVVVRSSWDSSARDVVAYLDRVIDQLDPDIDGVGRVLERLPDDSIHDLAGEYDDALLCLHSHGRSGLGHLVLGSESERILARSPVSALTVGPRLSAAWVLDSGPVGLCVDDTSDPEALARLVVPWAERLAAPVHVVTVRSEDARPISRFHPATAEQLDRVVGALAASGVHAQGVLLEDLQPARRVARYAMSHGLNLVIAAKRRSGLARDLLGSTTMSLVHQSPCPVLVTPGPAASPDASP